MAYRVLQSGFEDVVRSKLGVSEGELSNTEINQRLIADFAESTVLKKVPDYQSITDDRDLILLEGSIISYICYLLAPSMARRLNIEVSTLDVKWKKDKIDWQELALSFLGESELALMEIESVSVEVGGDSALVDYSRNERIPLG